MGLQDELEPMLVNIRTEAGKRYERYLSGIPDTDLHPEVYAKDRRDFDTSVEQLLGRFREFYALDAHDFTANVNQLSTPGEQKQRPLVSQPSPGTAFASILSADANFMRPVLEMIHTEQWNSPAATSFRNNFLQPFETASDWHGAYVKELAVAAETFRDTVDKTKKGIKFVAEGCLGAMRDHQVYEPSEGGGWRDQLGALSIFAAALGLFLPASGAALAVGGISLASGLASLKPPDKKPYLQVDYSEFPQMIIRNTGYAIKELAEMVLDVDEALARGLNLDLGSADSFASPHLKLPRPGIDASAYGQLDIKDADGKPPDQVVVSVVQLAKAGYYNLPGAAYEYDLALAKVDACQVPGGMRQFFVQAIDPFNRATGRLSGLLRQTKDDLNDAGGAMLTAARNYRATDEEQAEILRGIQALVPHHSRAPFH